MKAVATLNNMQSKDCKKRIVRNLSRILDIRIVNIDIENGMFFFLYSNPAAFEKVAQELIRLGYPMQSSLGPKPDIRYQIPEGTSSRATLV